jgi:hypothetical protein
MRGRLSSRTRHPNLKRDHPALLEGISTILSVLQLLLSSAEENSTEPHLEDALVESWISSFVIVGRHAH